MSVNRVAGRYAKSLLDLSAENGSLETVVADIKYFQQAVKNRDLYLLLKSPIISADKKEQVVKALFADKFNTVLMSFINICVNKGREVILPEIADEFIFQYKAMQGITTMKLTTATPVSDETIESIKAKFLQSASTADLIEVETKVNPELIGGFVVQYGDRLYDASVANKLNSLKKQFKVNNYDVKF